MSYRCAAAVTLVGFLVAFGGCTDTRSEIDAGDAPTADDASADGAQVRQDVAAEVAPADTGPDQASSPTFADDVLPILQARCTRCHPGFGQLSGFLAVVEDGSLEREAIDGGHGGLSVDEKVLILDWIAAGTPP